MSFVRTKIQPPTFRAGLIERPALNEQIAAALQERRLVLLVAPAGYGKTAVLSQQIRRLSGGQVAVWLSADEDDDLPRFLSCLAEALEPHDPPWRVAPETLGELAMREGGLRSAAIEWANVLAAMPVERGVIVLDDVQRITAPGVFHFLALLIDGLPAHWTIAMGSRTEPPLNLARLRVRQELAEFGVPELGFSQQEVEQLGAAADSGQSGEALRQLYQRTRGWAAGVCLGLEAARLAPTKRVGNRLGQRHLFDYLAAEVFDQMPQALRDFLLACSVLPELTAARCEAVSGNPNAAELLEEIERRGLFVTVLDGEELTLRMHDLFRDFLEDRLRNSMPERIPILLERAADHEPDPARKLGLLLRAGAWSRAEQELSQAALALLTADNSALTLRFVEQFPQAMREHSPVLAFIRGLCALQDLDWRTLLDAMERAARGFEECGRPGDACEARALHALARLYLSPKPLGPEVLAELSTAAQDASIAAQVELVAYWNSGYGGPPGQPAVHLSAMVDHLQAAGRPEIWYRCAPRVLMFVGRPGMREPMERFIRGALEAAGDNETPLQAAATVLSAWLHLWGGRLDKANEVIRQIEADSRWLGHPLSLQVPLLRLRAISSTLAGEPAQASASQQALLRDAQETRRPLNFRVMQSSLAGRCAAALEDWEGARRALDALESLEGLEVQPNQPFYQTLKAQLALHEDRNSEALEALRLVVVRSADADRMGLNAFARIQLCRAELRAGAPQAAWQAVAPLVEQFEESGESGGILLNGSAALREISHAAWGTAAPPQGVATLHRWAQIAQALRQPAPRTGPLAEAPAGGLSPRERGVLQLIAEGRSNKLIARELSLSPHTVKRHVARILERLDVASRQEAAAWLVKQERR